MAHWSGVYRESDMPSRAVTWSARQEIRQMVYDITDLSTFILGTIFIVLLPGPNSLYG